LLVIAKLRIGMSGNNYPKNLVSSKIAHPRTGSASFDATAGGRGAGTASVQEHRIAFLVIGPDLRDARTA
jgi:hypothetical protein